MKKSLALSIVTISLSMAAQAEIVKPNVFRKTFDINKTFRKISVIGLRITKVPSLLDVVPNPDYQVLESASSEITTVLEKATVVQATLRYESSDAGEIEGDEINANFALSDFSEEELTIIKGHNIFKKYKLVKNKVGYSIKTVESSYTYEYCADNFFDDYNRPLSECPRIATAIGKNVQNKLTVILK
jgi:hypothetical protein